MNLVKLGLILLIGVGFGVGLSNRDVTALFYNGSEDYHTTHHNWENKSGDYYGHMGGYSMMDDDYGRYFNEKEFIEHMLKDLSKEERLLVDSKIDELLTKYQMTLEDDDYLYDFMDELMDFLEENEINYHNYDNCPIN